MPFYFIAIYLINTQPQMILIECHKPGSCFMEKKEKKVQPIQWANVWECLINIRNVCLWVGAYVLFSNYTGIHYTVTEPSILLFWLAVFVPLRMMSGSDKSSVSVFFYFRRLLLGQARLVVLKHSSMRSVKSGVYARVSSIFLLHNCQGWTF